MNPDFQWGRGGRIEVYDQQSESSYAIYEARFFVPVEMADAFRECFDFKEFDHIPHIIFDLKEDE